MESANQLLTPEVHLSQNEFDPPYIEIRWGHIECLEADVRHPEADVFSIDTLNNLEWISDRVKNPGVNILSY
jgi:hypothetical protein